MRTIHRSDLSPRIDLLPLIDVIFLLLTFFIYSLMVMVRAQVLPVTLTALGSGEQPTPGKIHAITIDQHGGLFFDKEPVDSQELGIRLEQFVEAAEDVKLYLAMEEEGTIDRGPILIGLIERVRQAGITDFVIVGQPAN